MAASTTARGRDRDEIEPSAAGKTRPLKMVLKIVLLGDPGCGKTSLARCLNGEDFDHVYRPSLALNVYEHPVTFAGGGPPTQAGGSASPGGAVGGRGGGGAASVAGAGPSSSSSNHESGGETSDSLLPAPPGRRGRQGLAVRAADVGFRLWDVTLTPSVAASGRLAVLLRDADAVCFCYDVNHIGSFLDMEEWLSLVRECYAPPQLKTRGKIPLKPLIPPDVTRQEMMRAAVLGGDGAGGRGGGKANAAVRSVGMRVEEYLPHFILVGCKYESHMARRPVRFDRHRAFAADHGMAAYLTCARTGEGVSRLAADMARDVAGLPDGDGGGFGGGFGDNGVSLFGKGVPASGGATADVRLDSKVCAIQ